MINFHVQIALCLLCFTYLLYPSALPGWLPLYIWALVLAGLTTILFRSAFGWVTFLFGLTSLFAIHMTRRYLMYLKTPVGVFDSTIYDVGNANLPTSRTQSVFAPAPALNQEDRYSYLQSLKYAPRNLGGNNFDEKTLEETMVSELTPLGKSFLLPSGLVPSLPGVYFALDNKHKTGGV